MVYFSQFESVPLANGENSGNGNGVCRYIRAMGCRQCLFLSVVQLKGKHCGTPHCRNKVVDTFGHCTLYASSKDLKGRYHDYEKQVCQEFDFTFFQVPERCDGSFLVMLSHEYKA